MGDRVQQGRLLISAANVSVPWVSWRNGMVRDVPAVISAQLRLVEESCLRTVFFEDHVDALQVARLI